MTGSIVTYILFPHNERAANQNVGIHNFLIFKKYPQIITYCSESIDCL